eukprot:1695073-Prymnesium_polylepis.1
MHILQEPRDQGWSPVTGIATNWHNPLNFEGCCNKGRKKSKHMQICTNRKHPTTSRGLHRNS